MSIEGNSKDEIESTIQSIEDKSVVPEDRTKMWSPAGCDKCNHTGYKGRLGIFEAILMDKDVENAVKSGASDREIWEIAKKQAILTMKQDGVLKVLQGITSLEELERVIALED
jgi:type IV pilus assembly protein PilB